MAACPLGFGGPGAGLGELSSYHCPLCRGLLHDPVVTSGCRHVFCSFCIRRFRDCPRCGADINSTSADTSLATTIQRILLGHAKLVTKPSAAVSSVCPVTSSTPTSTKGAAACPVAPTASTSASSGVDEAHLDLPSVLLQLALQSLAGGNPEAALARLNMCADSLLSSTDSASTQQKGEPAGTGGSAAVAAAEGLVPPTESHACAKPASAAQGSDFAGDAAAANDPVLRRHLAVARRSPVTASRLGAILGVKADCYRRLGEPKLALRHYELSLGCLETWHGRNREVDSARSVTHNKLGDLLLMSGRLFKARDQYDKALEIRRQAVQMWKDVAILGPQKDVEAPKPQSASEESEAEAAGAAAAGAAASTLAPSVALTDSSAEDVVQDLCDLAVSLCKVADLGLALWEDDQRPVASQQLQAQTEAAEVSAATAAVRTDAEQQRGQRSTHEREKAGEEGEQQRQPSTGTRTEARAVMEQQQVGKVAELLTEARGVLLRSELLPYARACGIATAAETGAASTQQQLLPQGKAGDSLDGNGGPSASGAAVKGSSSSEQESGARAPGGKHGTSKSEELAPPLVARFGKVWSALEQLNVRMRQLGITGEA